MYSNPYQIFGIDETMEAYELRRILLSYKADAMKLKMLYSAYFNKVGNITMHCNNKSQLVEQLLCKRYEFGMDFDQIPLGQDEISDFLKRAIHYNSSSKGNRGLSTITAKDVEKRIEMFATSFWLVGEMDNRITEAIDAFDSDTREPKDDSKMMDVLVALRYGEIKAGIAEDIAQKASANGIVLDEKDFRNLILTSASYEQIKKIYEQIATKEKRDELIPELYVMNNMTDMSQITVMSEDEANRLIAKEHKYTSEYFDDLASRLDGSKDRASEPFLENQNHDFAWGIVLNEPSTIMDNEKVDTPIFKGRIKVERIGSFTEKSLFKRQRYIRETDIEVRRRAKAAHKKGMLSRLTMRKRGEKGSTDTRTMREHFYSYEARKEMMDNVWRVTKTGLDGKVSTHIIFTPLEYSTIRGSETLHEFVKNIYLSDYMLGIAAQNGGYAGRVHNDRGGFSISNKYSLDEVATAILFTSGQRGDILDCRDPKNKVKHECKTIVDFMNLINSRNRGERIKNE